MDDIVPVERIASKIYVIRQVKVMLDRDLAELYGVETRRLKEQVKRNLDRFPEDFMFELTKKELTRIFHEFF
ncbi:MAG: ORF6N domain-containing protein [Desulfosudaceae bacterium]